MTWENPGAAGTAMPNCVSKSDAIGARFPPFVQQFDLGISSC